MRQATDRILRGQFQYEDRELVLSSPRLTLSVREREKPEGVFSVFGREDMPLTATVTVSDSRMEVLTPEVNGIKADVSYRFNTDGLRAGDEVSGFFRIISDQGEAILPYTVKVRQHSLDSSMGEIVNLFHFANLARSDWNEALSLFYSREFIRIFSDNDTEYETLYRGLSKSSDPQEAMEEFLQAVSKKQKTEYRVEPEELVIDNPGGMVERTINITKIGWGYTDIHVETDGDFIITDRNSITSADFSGSNAVFRIRIDSGALHDGDNFGKITLKNCYGEVSVTVRVRVNLDVSHIIKDDREEKKLTLRLMRLYEDFRSGRITSRVWLSEVGKILTRFTAMYPDRPDIRLFTAQYLITSSRAAEGQWILDQISQRFGKGEITDDTLYCYYLYLTSLMGRNEEETDRIAVEIDLRYRRHPGDYRIAWLLQYVSRDCAEHPDRRYRLLTDQIRHGCTSPLIYLEGVFTLAQSPSLLIHLTEADIAILRYGARKGLLSDLLISQIVYLGKKEKNYNPQILYILMKCADVSDSSDALEAVCAMLIKGGRTDREAFDWYARGVEKQLRITRLYEYYMMSIYEDEDGLLPCEISRMVLMYFSYQSNLEYDKNAILYRYIHEHRDEYPELFETYRPQIGKYLMQQLDRGRNNRNLSYLYSNMLTKQMVDMENSPHVLAIVNTSVITTDEPDIEKVIVVYDKCEQEVEARFTDGEAYLPMYGSSCRLFLADHEGRRFATGRKFEVKKLMPGGELVEYAAPYLRAGRGNLDLYLSDLGRDGASINMENVDRYRDLAVSPLVREHVRQTIQEELIRFYYDNDFQAQLSEYLGEIEDAGLPAVSREKMANMLALTGNDERALAVYMDCGIISPDPRLLMRMCARLLENGRFPDDQRAVQLAWYAFSKGKYDAQLLSYLSREFDGTSQELRELMVACESFGIDTYSLSERLLLQILYSGALEDKRIGVYEYFVKRGGSGDIEKAFLAQSAYDDLVKGREADKLIYEQISRLSMRGEKLPDVCAIAWLKQRASSAAGLDEDESTLAEDFIMKLLAKSIYFPFFREYEDLIPVRERLLFTTGRTMLEYRTHKGAKLIIHYCRNTGENSEYQKTEFTEMLDGIFVTSFLMFKGEEMAYYITEESSDGRNERMVESGTLYACADAGHFDSGRYSMINEISEACAEKDTDTASRLMDEYCMKDYVSSMLFVPVEVTVPSAPVSREPVPGRKAAVRPANEKREILLPITGQPGRKR